jgi:uracil-DNA glycosylase family protein
MSEQIPLLPADDDSPKARRITTANRDVPRFPGAEVPATDDWEMLKKAALGCRGCDLYRRATQTVFGEGERQAKWMLLGEQPGDQEDIAGKPFVGPAGKLLDRALADAGIDRAQCYVTNAVKHFKWEPRGKRRLHQKPDNAEIAACRGWWEAELRLIAPQFLVCLGGTAARAVFGRAVKVMQERGTLLETPWSKQTLVTVHPSALLRLPDPELREQGYAEFVQDLKLTTKGK